MEQTILVTGGKGFVGRHLCAALQVAYPEARLCILDHPSSGICAAAKRVETDGGAIRLSADLTCAEDLKFAMQALLQHAGPPDLVFHLAAQAEVGRSFIAPSQTYEVNVVGTARLLEALTDITLKARVLIPSSALVYAPPRFPEEGQKAATIVPLLDESAPIGPTSHYGASKFAQEQVGKLFWKSTGLPVLITRAFNHIGPGQGTGFLVPDLARQIALAERAAAHGKANESEPAPAVIRVGNLDARRDYLDVRDVVDAYLTVVERGTPGCVYNVASGVTWSGRELLDVLCSEAALPIQVEIDPRLLRPIDIPALAGDASRLRGLGWSPRRDIKETLKETLQYWRRVTGASVKR